MLNTERNRLKQNSLSFQTAPAERNTATTYLQDYSGDEIKEALHPGELLTNPLEELIATGEAVFEFIRQSEMDLDLKNAFGQMQKQFEFYKNLTLQ